MGLSFSILIKINLWAPKRRQQGVCSNFFKWNKEYYAETGNERFLIY